MKYQCCYNSLSSCRVVDDEILLTMDDGRGALKVLELDGEEVIILLRGCEAICVINFTSWLSQIVTQVVIGHRKLHRSQ